MDELAGRFYLPGVTATSMNPYNPLSNACREKRPDAHVFPENSMNEEIRYERLWHDQRE
jgi:hypothetical protein